LFKLCFYLSYHKTVFRIIYKKIYDSEKEAVKALKELDGKASSPSITQGKSGGWLVVLYEHEKRSRIEEGMKHYEAAGLTVYMQKTDG